ncbi:unnamed protein product [Urochloa humidicola]
MEIRVPPVPMDGPTEDLWRSQGMDPQSLQDDTLSALSLVHFALPDQPVSHHAPLSALPALDGADRISSLPDAFLRGIVSRLPVKDGARTAALSRRWRGVWRSTPLILVDAHLLPPGREAEAPPSHAGAARAEGRGVAAAVTRVLHAHPGPIRYAYLTSSHMEAFPGLLARWLQTLAIKGVRHLVLINRPWPLNMDLPATFFGMATLKDLFLGFWKFPDTAELPRGVAFPHLRELGLSCMGIENWDMDFVLAKSPVLRSLCIQASILLRRLSLVSRSLRCVQIIAGIDLEIAVEDVPQLERLIMWSSSARDGLPRRVNIGHAPTLTVLGYLEPKWHVLQVGNTIIKAGTRANPSTMVSSVKILGLKVCFGVRNDAKMLPSFLRCFPNVESLHLQSQNTDEPTGKLNMKFWREVGAIECVQSHIKLMIFRDFRGERSELAFLKFFLESAQVLKELVIVFSKGSFTSMMEANSKVKHLLTAKRASQTCSILLIESAWKEGDDKWYLDFRGSDFSVRDPFAFIPQD